MSIDAPPTSTLNSRHPLEHRAQAESVAQGAELPDTLPAGERFSADEIAEGDTDSD